VQPASVTRPAAPWSASVQALLAHLRARGLGDAVPEPRGIDARGDEVVGRIEGDVPAYPLPAWVWEEGVLLDAARLLRRLHDASAGFALAGRRWQLPAREPAEVVCHNDFAPHNLVFRDGRLAGVIDFEAAAPGPRAWDLAHLAYRIVPLTTPSDRERDDERAGRLERLCAAYGADTAAVLDLVAPRLDALAAHTAARARATGDPAFDRHVALYEADAAYVRTTSRRRRPA
jgi:hypothetical protein